MPEDKHIPPPPVVRAVITEERAGQRLDNFLIARYRELPKSHIYRIVRSGEVRINSKRVKPMVKLCVGDVVRIPPITARARGKIKITPQTCDRFEQRIVTENKDFMIIDKPSGLAVHSGTANIYGAVDIIKAMRPKDDIALVHRIDKMVSGCLMVSKNRRTLLSLHRLLRNAEMQKSYLALVSGHWKRARVVDFSLERQEEGQTVDPRGKVALSRFSPSDYYSHFTLMDISIMTGRTHQIRVHASHSKHPIAGDEKYGDFTINRAMHKRGLRRIFLHASHLAFDWYGVRQEFRIPLPDELQKILDTL